MTASLDGFDTSGPFSYDFAGRGHGGITVTHEGFARNATPSFEPTPPIPEPSTLLRLSVALGGFAARCAQRRK
jgi:hypothetical protein